MEASSRLERMRPLALGGALAGVVVALDQATKQLTANGIEWNHHVDLGLGFQLANVRNKGVAFGLLGGAQGPVLALALAALALLVAYLALRPGIPGLWVAVGLVSGGALGNLADRLRIGAVIDFLDPPAWPAFNLADAAIVAGVALLVIVLSTPRERHGTVGDA
jgi:signal peptidase II